MAVVLKDKPSLPAQVLGRVSGDQAELQTRIESLLSGFSSQSPAPEDLGPNNAMRAAFKEVENLQKTNGDSHVSLPDLFLAVCKQKHIREALSAASFSLSQIEAAIKDSR